MGLAGTAEKARSYRCEHALLLGLLVAEKLCGWVVPATVRPWLEQRGGLDRHFGLIVKAITHAEGWLNSPAGIVQRNLYAASFNDRLDCWTYQAATVATHRRDWELLPLPDALFPLYFALSLFYQHLASRAAFSPVWAGAGASGLKMIDLHCHLLPGIDDGAPDLETSLEMARIAFADGIRTLACTPHIYPGVYENTGDGIRQAVAALQKALDEAEIALKLVVGADIHVDPDLLLKLRGGEAPTLGGTRYFLLEPPHHVALPRIADFVFNLVAAGYTPDHAPRAFDLD